MRLLEYQGKTLLAAAGVSVPRGEVTRCLDDVPVHVARFGPRVVVKAQVRSGGRAKRGGILMADGEAEAFQAAQHLLGSQLGDEEVGTFLIEERLEVAAELYAGVLVDREVGAPLVMLGAAGGVEVEALAAEQPTSLARTHLDLALGLQAYQVRYLLNRAGVPGESREAVADVLRRLLGVFQDYDALLLEINPLALLADGRVVALDARLETDDNALFRQPAIAALRELTPTEQRVEEAGFHFLELQGDVGLISTGSGACMALMDLLTTRGLRPANFIELGQSMATGGAEVATEILLDRPDVQALLVAGFSGAQLDRLAAGVLEVLARHPWRDLPVVVSLQGRNDAEAMRLAAESHDPRVVATPGYRAAVDRLAELLKQRRRPASAPGDGVRRDG